jgi:NitT/TauT family transport system permease protein
MRWLADGLVGVARRAGGLTALVLLVLTWQLVTVVFDVPAYLLPPPASVGETIVENRASLWHHGLITLAETLIGFGLSVVVGLLLAVAITYSLWMERLLYPILVGSQAIPKVAVAPILLVWLGFGMFPKVLVAFLIGFFPVVVTAASGLASVRPDMLKLAASMGASGWDVFWKVRLPFAMPSILSGFKVAVTLTVVGAVVGEFVGSNAGLGYYILVATGNLDTALVFANVVVLTVIGVSLFYAVELVERAVTSWRFAGAGASAKQNRGMAWSP